MNFDKLAAAILGLVIVVAAAGQLPELQRWLMSAQAQIIRDSRTSTWGSPRFFPDRQFVPASK